MPSMSDRLFHAERRCAPRNRGRRGLQQAIRQLPYQRLLGWVISCHRLAQPYRPASSNVIAHSSILE